MLGEPKTNPRSAESIAGALKTISYQLVLFARKLLVETDSALTARRREIIAN